MTTGRSRKRSPRTGSVSSFLFVFSVSVGSGLPVLGFSYSHFVLFFGRNVETTESCGNDAGDVCAAELEEPVAKPGTTIGTRFSVLHCIRLPSLMRCGF